MSVTWHTVDGTFRIHREEIITLCEKHFGPEHDRKYNPLSGKFRDNHGNWQMTFETRVLLRYKRDVTWFLLRAGHLVDPPPMTRWGMGCR